MTEEEKQLNIDLAKAVWGEDCIVEFVHDCDGSGVPEYMRIESHGQYYPVQGGIECLK
jgi:hypothetical protein